MSPNLDLSPDVLRCQNRQQVSERRARNSRQEKVTARLQKTAGQNVQNTSRSGR